MPKEAVAVNMMYDSSIGRCDSICKNINVIDIDVLSEVEEDLEDYELVSLVFLLYDDTYVALERLAVLQLKNSSASSSVITLSLLHDWALKARSRQFWRYELLEALAICQLYSNIRKLGFDVEEVKSHFLPSNLNTSLYIHPLKKVLYKFCEDITSSLFNTLISSLDVDLNLANGLPYEIYIMTLIQMEYISLGYWDPLGKTTIQVGSPMSNVKNFLNILKVLGMKDFDSILAETQDRINKAILLEIREHKSKEDILKLHRSIHVQDEKTAKVVIDCKKMNKLFENLLNNDVISKNVVEHAKSERSGCYNIYDPTNLGLCYIINQRNFHKSYISNDREATKLEDRNGTDVDRDELVKTWTRLGFRTIVHENVESCSILEKIDEILQKQVNTNDSAFVLCILSHGLKGVIFGSDALPVAIANIEKKLYHDKLRGKPKILLIQACQNNEITMSHPMKKDGPQVIHSMAAPPKSDIVVFCATIPEHSALRDEINGTWFIQTLCNNLIKYYDIHHLLDIFTKVTGDITKLRFCNEAQVPCHTTSLRKFFYFSNYKNKN